jgi:hypothetical protein
MSRCRQPGPPAILIVFVVVLAALTLLAFLPLLRCPGCDPHLHVRNLDGTPLEIVEMPVKYQCSGCDGTKRVSLFKRWQIKKDCETRMGYTFPLF